MNDFQIPEPLKYSLSEQNVIPFVGSGVSMSVRDKSASSLFPSWKDLLLTAADELDREKNTKNAELVRAEINAGKPNGFLKAAETAREGLGGEVCGIVFYENN